MGAAFLLLLLAAPGIPGGDDGYRHAKLAWGMIRDPGGTLSNPWSLVYFWPKPVDAWFGYHLLLAPLTLVLEPVAAVKVFGSIIFGSIAFVLLKILGDLKVPRGKAWAAIALAGSATTLYRSCLCRPFLLSVLLVLLAALFTLREKPLAVGIASAVHALSYSMFFLVALAPLAYLAVRRNRPALRLGAACLAGIAAGLLCNPYFPENVRFDLTVAAAGPLTVGLEQGVKVGRELGPFKPDHALTSLPVLAAWLLALVAALTTKLTAGSRVYLILSAVTLLASFRVMRTFDYFVPLAAVFSAAILSPRGKPPWNKAYAAGAVLAAVLCGLHGLAVYGKITADAAPDRFRGASEYLGAHGRGAVVFNTQWQQYPFLYFWNSRSLYVTGIEPTLMFVQDPRRYWLWRHIADDETTTCDTPRCTAANSKRIGAAIAEFGADFVITERGKNPRVEQVLRNDPALKEVYRDGDSSVFAVYGL